MEPDYTSAKFWFDVVQTVLILLVGVMNWLTSRQRVTNQTIETLERDLDGKLDLHSDRLARVEQDIKHAPDHSDFKRVHQRMDGVNGEIKEMKGELTGIKTTLNLIHQYLIEKRQ